MAKATHVLWDSPLYLADGYCSVYSIHDSVGASDQEYTVSDCVTNFAHTQLIKLKRNKMAIAPRPSPA